MQTAKVFQNGNAQAVQLPEDFRFDSNRVYIKRIGNAVVLLPIETAWDVTLGSLALFSPDFMAERIQPPVQERT